MFSYGGMSSLSDHETIPHPSSLSLTLNHGLSGGGKYLLLYLPSPNLSKTNSCGPLCVSELVYELANQCCVVLISFQRPTVVLPMQPCSCRERGTHHLLHHMKKEYKKHKKHAVRNPMRTRLYSNSQTVYEMPCLFFSHIRCTL